MAMRRFEVLLPSQFNDGRDVMQACMECFPATLMDVVGRFGALSYDPNSIQGIWTTMSQRYDDKLFRLTVDVPDTDESRAWMAAFKRELVTRFEQFEIYVVSFMVDVV